MRKTAKTKKNARKLTVSRSFLRRSKPPTKNQSKSRPRNVKRRKTLNNKSLSTKRPRILSSSKRPKRLQDLLLRRKKSCNASVTCKKRPLIGSQKLMSSRPNVLARSGTDRLAQRMLLRKPSNSRLSKISRLLDSANSATKS